MSGRQKYALIFFCLALLLYPTAVSADGFTGEQFLKWPRESQDSLIETSVAMTAIVATQGRQDIASCIDQWYPVDEAVRAQRHGLILDTIGKYPLHHPQGVILAVIQKQCGSFKG